MSPHEPRGRFRPRTAGLALLALMMVLSSGLAEAKSRRRSRNKNKPKPAAAKPAPAPTPVEVKPTAPPPEETHLQRAHRLHRDLEFDGALLALDKAQRQPNTRADLIAIYELRGLMLGSLGRPKAARKVFMRMLVIDPEHKLPPYVAPRLAAELDGARAELEGRGSLRAELNAPRSLYQGDIVTAEIVLANDPLGMVDRVEIGYRLASAPPEEAKAVQAAAGPKMRVAIPVPTEDTAEGKVLVWCRLLDAFGSELALLNSAADPVVISWEPKPDLGITPQGQIVDIKEIDIPDPIYSKWWFWTAIGVVAAGVATTAVIVTMPQTPGCTNPDFCNALR